MANQILTRQDAYNIGGGGTLSEPLRCCTKSIAESYGCTVADTYLTNQLISSATSSKRERRVRWKFGLWNLATNTWNGRVDGGDVSVQLAEDYYNQSYSKNWANDHVGTSSDIIRTSSLGAQTAPTLDDGWAVTINVTPTNYTTEPTQFALTLVSSDNDNIVLTDRNVTLSNLSGDIDGLDIRYTAYDDVQGTPMTDQVVLYFKNTYTDTNGHISFMYNNLADNTYGPFPSTRMIVNIYCAQLQDW